MRTNMQHDVKIPGRPAAPPGFTVAGRAQPGPRIDARWNAQCDLRGALPPPAAAASFAGLVHRPAGSLALGTSLGDAENPPRTNHLAASATRRAGAHS